MSFPLKIVGLLKSKTMDTYAFKRDCDASIDLGSFSDYRIQNFEIDATINFVNEPARFDIISHDFTNTVSGWFIERRNTGDVRFVWANPGGGNNLNLAITGTSYNILTDLNVKLYNGNLELTYNGSSNSATGVTLTYGTGDLEILAAILNFTTEIGICSKFELHELNISGTRIAELINLDLNQNSGTNAPNDGVDKPASSDGTINVNGQTNPYWVVI